MSEAVTYPKEIAKAIIVVKKQVKQLGSNEKNPHGGYSYVSVDKFYDRIGKLMAEAGLALLIDETASEVKEGGKSDKPWLFTQYSLAFMHETGVVSDPLHRSLAMPITGPQTYGAAQSYIEKQFLRQVFKVPTGEKDADEAAEAIPPARTAPQPRLADHVPPNANGANGINGAALPPNPEEPPAINSERERIRGLIKKIEKQIDTAPDEHRLNIVMDDARDKDIPQIKGYGPAGIEKANELQARYEERRSALRAGK